MADIFGRDQLPVGGVFSSDKALMTISGAGELGLGALVQSVNVTYQQNFTMLFELGSNNIYPLLGRPQGSLTIGRIVANSGFSEAFFNACNGGTTVSLNGVQGACGKNASIKGQLALTCHGVFVTNYGFDMSVQDLMIKENVTCTFTSLTRS